MIIENHKLLVNIVTISKENFVMTVGLSAQDMKIRSVMGSGGMVGATDGTMRMSGIIGQLAIETVRNSSEYDVNQGFWVPLDDPTGVEDQQQATSMLNNFPNPVNDHTTIRFSVEKTSHVTLKVYDLVGNVVKVLADGIQQPGEKNIDWNVRDESGKILNSGSYMYELTITPMYMKGSGNGDTYRNLMIIVR
jgi:hypothetical protein